MTSSKPVHTLVLDTGGIIKNEPPVSTLLSRAESLVTVPEILTEIRDAATRSRFETTLRPFLTIRSPSPKSVQFVREFARKTGDLPVLSQPDILIIALTYELECERNGGDWRLRRVPGQQGLNGTAPTEPLQQISADAARKQAETTVENATETDSIAQPEAGSMDQNEEPIVTEESPNQAEVTKSTPESRALEVKSLDIDDQANDQETQIPSSKVDSAQASAESQSDLSDPDSDAEGWITPSNLKQKQSEDANNPSSSKKTSSPPKVMQVAVLTTDFAMQNVILRMNLNLLSPSTMSRIKHLKTHILRCHACFQVCKDLTKQFCPRCGGPTLTRVSCSTNANGEFKLHLKKNMQWNNKGNKYSIPKPVHGSANGRVKGGGKGGWGNELILAEDQKEYLEKERAEERRRKKERDLMDGDYLPGILTGERGGSTGGGGGRIKVGAGRNVNARKR